MLFVQRHQNSRKGFSCFASRSPFLIHRSHHRHHHRHRRHPFWERPCGFVDEKLLLLYYSVLTNSFSSQVAEYLATARRVDRGICRRCHFGGRRRGEFGTRVVELPSLRNGGGQVFNQGFGCCCCSSSWFGVPGCGQLLGIVRIAIHVFSMVMVGMMVDQKHTILGYFGCRLIGIIRTIQCIKATDK